MCGLVGWVRVHELCENWDDLDEENSQKESADRNCLDPSHNKDNESKPTMNCTRTRTTLD